MAKKGGGALPRLSETDFVQGVFGTLNWDRRLIFFNEQVFQ